MAVQTIDLELCREAHQGKPYPMLEIARQIPSLDRDKRIEVRQVADRFEVWQNDQLFAISSPA